MFILYITGRYSHFNILFSKPCQRQYELLPSLGVRRLMSNLHKRTFHRCFLPSFDSFGQAVSEQKIFFKSTNQEQELPVAAMFGNGS
jgi:hypothetical protein